MTDEEIIRKADEMHASSGHDLRQTYEYLIKHKDSSNAGILWRTCRAARDLRVKGVAVPPDENKKIVLEAFDSANKALAIDKEDWACHKWFAITLHDRGPYLGVRERLSQAFTVKDHLEKSLKLNPSDAMSAHYIGLWCKDYAHLSWDEKKIAASLFSAPPTSTYEKALEMFLLAEKIHPNFYSVNLLELGICYNKIDDMANAALYWKKLQYFLTYNEEDEEALQKARKHLEGIPDKYKV